MGKIKLDEEKISSFQKSLDKASGKRFAEKFQRTKEAEDKLEEDFFMHFKDSENPVITLREIFDPDHKDQIERKLFDDEQSKKLVALYSTYKLLQYQYWCYFISTNDIL